MKAFTSGANENGVLRRIFVDNLKFLPALREGEDMLEWCRKTKPDVYQECSSAFARREKETTP
jgi:hypothetical protein